MPCEKVRPDPCKSQFYLSFWRSNLISCEMVALDPCKSQFYLMQFLAIEPHFVRKGRTRANRNFTSVFGDRCPCKSQFYPSFWRSNFISCQIGLRRTRANRNFTRTFKWYQKKVSKGSIDIFFQTSSVFLRGPQNRALFFKVMILIFFHFP